MGGDSDALGITLRGQSVGRSAFDDSILFQPECVEDDPSFINAFYQIKPEARPTSRKVSARSKLHPGLGRLNTSGQSRHKHHPMYEAALRGPVEPDSTGFLHIPQTNATYKDKRFHNPAASSRDVPRAWTSQTYKRLFSLNSGENPKPRLGLNTTILPPHSTGRGNQQVTGAVTLTGKKYLRSSFQHGLYCKSQAALPTAAVLVKCRHVRVVVGARGPDGVARQSERQTTVHYADGSSEILVEKVF
jgi:hypothetical protein